MELCLPWNKIHQKHFKIKATPIWHFNSFINDSLSKATTRRRKFLALPNEHVKGDTVNLRLSQTSFLFKWRYLLAPFFSFADIIKNYLLVCEIHIRRFAYYPSDNTQELTRESIVPPYKTPPPAAVDFSGEKFFNNDMNLPVCLRLFAFKLKWKILHLFVKTTELTKYLKINL